jgi:transposase
MPKQLKIEIKESEQSLRRDLRKTSTDMYRAKIKTLLLIKSGKYKYKREWSSKLGYCEHTIKRWLSLYEKDGYSSYLQVNFKGNAVKKISNELSEAIFKELNNPKTTITSYVELFALMKEKYKVDFPYITLYDHCRKKYNSVLKVSRKSHYKKDEEAVEAFKKLQKQSWKHII